MNWKLLLKNTAMIGILLIPLNLFYLYVSIYIFYEAILWKDIILLTGLFLLAMVSIFRYVYRKTENFRVIQSIATVLLAEIFGYFLSIVVTLIVLKIVS